MMSLDAERFWRFMGAGENYSDAGAVIFGIPMDSTVTVRTGTRHGAREIRQTSWWMEEYSPRLDRDLSEIKFYDAGDLCLPWGNVQEGLRLIRETGERIINDGKMPVMLGGEHLVSLPLIEAVSARNPGLAVIQLDAHADLNDQYLGEKYSHATVMRRVSEVVGSGNLYQIGIRSCVREEIRYGKEHTHIYLQDVLEPMKQVVRELAERPVYLTLDIDVVDPAYAPGTGAPEPGGCTGAELVESVYLLKNLNLVGFDLVEVCPDATGRTALLAAKVIREMLLTCL